MNNFSSVGPPVELLASPWTQTFFDLVGAATEELLIVSPFLTASPLSKVVEIVVGKRPALRRVDLVTNLAVDSLLSGSVDAAAVLHFAQAIPGSCVTYLPGLHAKVYVADDKIAVVTSGNLTNGGLVANHEYGVLLREPLLVRQASADLRQYAALGSEVPLDALAAINQAAQELKGARRQADADVGARLKALFHEKTEAAQLELLKVRAQGKTTHGIFCASVLYLLARHGPLSTGEMHPLVQQMHPDLCDDSVDRIINGVHFGKKWKHHIRGAQVSLRRRGVIQFDGKCWST
jgi:hypothetical protein